MASCVCSKCLESNPTRINLINDVCYEKRQHASAPKVRVTWTAKKRLNRVPLDRLPPIRPVPKVYFKGKFSLCDGIHCKGEKCTFPHNLEERDAWNEKKLGGYRSGQSLLPCRTLPPSQSHPTTVPSHPHPMVPSPQSQPATSPAQSQLTWAEVAKPKRQRHLSEPGARSLQPTVSQRGQQPSDPIVPVQKQMESVAAAKSDIAYGQQYSRPDPPSVESRRMLSESTVSPPANEWGLTGHVPFHSSQFDPYGKLPMDPFTLGQSEPPRRSLLSMELQSHSPNGSEWPQFPAQVSPASPVFHPETANLHSDLPPVFNEPPMQLPVSVSQPMASSQSINGQQTAKHIWEMDYAASRLTFHERLRDKLEIADIQQELTRANYKEKFNKLLCWEEMEHIHILDDRNGHYPIALYQAGLKPYWMKFGSKPSHKRFGYILELNCDQIAYVTQASEGALILQEGIEIKADILRENFQRIDEKLYVAFDSENLKKLEDTMSVPKTNFERTVHVQFELKHFYFNNLHKSLDLLPSKVISRIMPDSTNFPHVNIQRIPDRYRNAIKLSTCSADQLQALQTMVSCPSDGPPILITGPFGTGKTRILATAAHYFIREGKTNNRPTRILVCTQQQVSADSFLQIYIDLVAPKERDLCIIRLGGREQGPRNFKLKRWYRTVARFRRDFERSSDSKERSFLIITTCQTSLNIADMFPDFFTHILLDEGAQMREPEGVAPLCMAGKHTKIVIAGDQHQVGPAMLVLGDEAQENGLAVSLLERLQSHYKEMGSVAKPYCATLVTNYRCHEKIVQLSEKLFYETPLKCNVDSDSTHPDARFPLRFICSSVDDTLKYVEDAKNYKEADIALREAARIAEKWPVDKWGPKDLAQTCFMSTARSQITLATILVRRHMPHKMNELRKYPTYDIQGREFRALFLSTSEPTKKNGDTCNPTKSICDRYVFNTAITRARSLVVSVGNPFMLLKTERHMIRKYGEKGKCWSQYLKTCLDNGTLIVHSSLKLSRPKQQACIEKLRRLVEDRLAIPKSSPSHAKVNQVYRRSQEEPSKSAVATPVSEPVPTQSTGPTKDEHCSPQPEPNKIPEPVHTKEDKDSHHSEGYLSGKFEERYEEKERLGKGGFGVVYRVKKIFDNQDYAVKIIRLRRSKSKVLREVHALAKLDHQRIVRYFDAWMEMAPADWRDREPWSALKSSSESRSLTEQSQSPTVTASVGDSSAATSPSSAETLSQATGGSASEGNADNDQQESSDSVVVFCDSTSETPRVKESFSEETPQAAGSLLPQPPTCLFIQTQLCRKETLRHWLNNNRDQRPRQLIIGFFDQTLDAVRYIHKKKLIHRDLKPANIFFSAEDGSIKVGDFGLVTGDIPDLHSLTPPGQHQSPPYRSPAGSWYYMSPEQLSGKRYNEKVDIFALGVILFELNCPFSTEMERFKLLTDVRNQKIPPNFADKLSREATLINSLLAQEPSKRPSAEEVYRSTLLVQVKRSIKKSSKSHPNVTKL